jgi:hypothetical protein
MTAAGGAWLAVLRLGRVEEAVGALGAVRLARDRRRGMAAWWRGCWVGGGRCRWRRLAKEGAQDQEAAEGEDVRRDMWRRSGEG